MPDTLRERENFFGRGIGKLERIGDTQMRAAEYVEKEVAEYMKGREIVIRVDAGVGAGRATVWTCDLTHDYVSINADYRS